ncbi:MAG TPA: alpha/beta fold hydrolase [Actinomycetota bacterium]|jgi:pimeloyl-ACP methyl ester carboxylesterase|nr:alpha/beta fold hydrolase [Actinomycetota bacterium]
MRTTRAGSIGVRVLGVTAVLVLLGGCSDREPALVDLSGSEPVSFSATDGVRLEGRLFGEGSAAVVLSHMRPADQRSWFGFATRLADDGYLVLTYDFRGYCPGDEGGCSEGETDIDALWRDVLGAVTFVRERGADRVALVGASMGGTASLVAASQLGADVDVVITLSAPASTEGLVVDQAVLAEVGAATLFLAGVGDAPYAEDAQTLYALAQQPKRVEILPSDDHGTDLLTGGQGEVVRRTIENYLAQHGGP